MRESYQVIFNSQTSDIINKDNLAEVTYNINWGSFLPKKYRRFDILSKIEKKTSKLVFECFFYDQLQ